MLPVLRPEPRPRFRRGQVSGGTSQPSRLVLVGAGRAGASGIAAGSSSCVARPAIALLARGDRRGGMATAWLAKRQGPCRGPRPQQPGRPITRKWLTILLAPRARTRRPRGAAVSGPD